MQKTHQERMEARNKYIHLKKGDLENYSVPELRKLAAEVETGVIDRDGKKVSLTNARKSELIEIIWRILQDQIAINAYRSEQEDIDRANDYIIELNDRKLSGVAEIAPYFYLKLSDYTGTLWNGEVWREYDGGLIALCTEFVNALKSLQSKTTGTRIKDTTLLRYKRRCFEVLENLLSESTRSPEFKQQLEVILKAFERQVNRGFATETIAKNLNQERRLSERKHDIWNVHPANLVNWADRLLTELEPDEPNKGGLWLEVICALVIVSGRRPAEIASSAKFEVCPKPEDYAETDFDNWVMFSGQLKTKGSESNRDYEIPVLTSAYNLPKAIAWLESHNRRVEDAEKAHNRYSSDISKRFKDIEFRVSQLGTLWSQEKPTGTPQPKLTAKACRQIYAQLIRKEAHKINMNEQKFMSLCLGHNPLDNNTVQSYDSDFRVVD